MASKLTRSDWSIAVVAYACGLALYTFGAFHTAFAGSVISWCIGITILVALTITSGIGLIRGWK